MKILWSALLHRATIINKSSHIPVFKQYTGKTYVFRLDNNSLNVSEVQTAM